MRSFRFSIKIGFRLRYSKTRKDKDFYESLYQCLTYCACLTFVEADPDVIRTEMGRQVTWELREVTWAFGEKSRGRLERSHVGIERSHVGVLIEFTWELREVTWAFGEKSRGN